MHVEVHEEVITHVPGLAVNNTPVAIACVCIQDLQTRRPAPSFPERSYVGLRSTSIGGDLRLSELK